MDWNVTISQALPWRSVFEVSYVANKSQNEWIDGSNGKLGDQNNINPGSFFLPDPSPATSSANYLMTQSPSTPCNSSTPTANQPLVCSGPNAPTTS